MMKVILACLLLSTCAQQFQDNLARTNAWFNTYGPIIGKDLLMIGNILVQAECSPALVSGTATAVKVANNPTLLKITGATSANAATATSILSANLDVANALCPYVMAIKAQVGTVPAGVPSQVIPGV